MGSVSTYPELYIGESLWDTGSVFKDSELPTEVGAPWDTESFFDRLSSRETELSGTLTVFLQSLSSPLP